MLKLLPKLFKPELDTVQIELSSYCDASCIYCPLTIYKKNIERRFLPLEAMEILLPQIKKDTYIHLQGWGESLLHPDFLTIFKMIKYYGFKTGLTTNGNLLSDDLINEFVENGLDYIAFSTASHKEFENDNIRKGTSLYNIQKKIDKIKKVKSEKSRNLPKIHIANIILKSFLSSFYESPEFYLNLMPDQIVSSSLSLVCSGKMRNEVFLADFENQWNSVSSILESIRENHDLDLNYHIVSPFILKNECSENIRRSIFIGSKGDVYPCVIKGVPLKRPVDFYLRNKNTKLDNMSFGNIINDPLREILKNKKYRKFTHNKITRTDFCRICLKRSVVSLENQDLEGSFDSLDYRWSIIREANQENEDRKRLKKEVELFNITHKNSL